MKEPFGGWQVKATLASLAIWPVLKTGAVEPEAHLDQPRGVILYPGQNIQTAKTAASEPKEMSNRDAILKRRSAALKRMAALRHKAVADGMRLLNEDEILREVARRRGEDEA